MIQGPIAIPLSPQKGLRVLKYGLGANRYTFSVQKGLRVLQRDLGPVDITLTAKKG